MQALATLIALSLILLVVHATERVKSWRTLSGAKGASLHGPSGSPVGAVSIPLTDKASSPSSFSSFSSKGLS